MDCATRSVTNIVTFGNGQGSLSGARPAIIAMYVFILGKWRRATTTLFENGFGSEEDEEDDEEASDSTKESSSMGEAQSILQLRTEKLRRLKRLQSI